MMTMQKIIHPVDTLSVIIRLYNIEAELKIYPVTVSLFLL